MDKSRKKLLIITASILLHAVALFVIFVLYHQPSHVFADFDPSKAIDVAETVFYDPPAESEQSPTPAQSEPDTQWGQFKPRASTLGASMEMPDEPIGIETPGEASDGNSDAKTQTEDGTDSQETTNSQNSLEFNPQIKFQEGESVVTSIGAQSESSPSTSTAKARAKKQARKALAGITRGYLQQLQDEGENLIKTLGGDPNKKPTAEQLKYERYLAKIQWCLQNAHSINQHKCMSQEPIEAAMRVYFVLDRDGKMNNFKIVQSSGNAYVDQYMSALFASASGSFPPLPAYIKEDHFPLTYTILVNWSAGSHTGFSRY